MATPEEIRAAGIRKDIYARHGIPEGTDPKEAVGLIEMNAAKAGAQPSAWANPEERAAAREQYASAGKTPDEVQKRWDDSIYLMDPQTQQYRQGYARDAEFLDRLGVKDARDPAVEAWTGPVDPAGLAAARTQDAVQAWDQTNSNPLFRDSWASSGWADQGSVLANLVNNPDLPTGRLVNMSNIPYNFLAMQGSGETASAGDSWRTAVGEYQSASRNRPHSAAPILDLPSGATPEQRAARLAELQKEAVTAAVPDSGERWLRTQGYVPAPVLRDAGDAALATLDGTQLIPGLTLGKTAAKGAARAAAAGVARDMATDAGVSAGIMAGFAQKPGRTWSQYLGLSPEDDGAVTLKSPQQVEEANEARSQRFDRSLRSAGVSTADDEAYKRLQQAGKAPYRNQ